MAQSFIKYTLLFLVNLSCVFARSNTIDNLKISSIISQDGTVSIVETRTFNFKGRYKFTYLKINKKLFKEIYDIRVSEGATEYINSSNSEPNTFQIQNRKKSIRIKWFHYAEDTEKVFTVSYKLKGALRIGHNDTQFHWTYLGKGWDVKTKKLTIEQNFEEELQKNDIWYKATGLGKDRLQTTFNRGTITLEADNISKKSRIRINTIFPSTYLIEPIVNDSSFSIETELENINIKELGSKFGLIISFLFMAVSVIAVIIRSIKYGREHRIEKLTFEGKLHFPSSHHPALVSYFITYQKLTGTAILATLFRLASNGYFIIQETETIKESFFRKKKKKEKKVVIQLKDISTIDSLDQWDSLLVRFVSLQINSGVNYLDEIFKKIGASTSFVSDWNKYIDQEIINNDWLEKAPKRSTAIFFITHLVMISISIYLIKYNPALSIISGILLLIIGLVGSFAMIRMSHNCRLLKKKWENFGDKIKYKKNLENCDLDDNLLLQYSVVSGLDSYQIKQLLKSFNYDTGDFIWFHDTSISSMNTDSFTSSFTNMIDTGSAISAGFGGDGGAGGGGGGAGGGGGGGSG
tara:strand:+ start:174 stop:1907 length:1734 start_codon:yes stop_codon:yes gene_type:complete